MAIPVGHEDALVGGDRDAVRVRDQPLTECADESAVAVEHDDWRISALANVQMPLVIGGALADHPHLNRRRKIPEGPLNAIDLVTKPDVERRCAHDASRCPGI